MKTSNKNPLTKKILDYLQETSKNLMDLSLDIFFDPKKLDLIKLYGEYNHYPISKKINNLKLSPYFSTKGNKFYLSEKGRIIIIKNIIECKKKIPKWDNVWRAIIFDIPEIDRRERNFLRRELKWMGFKELQHSVWITPYDIEKELSALLKLWHKDFRGDIKFLEINKITEDSDIKKLFNI